jgi:ATP-dependent RNA helicase RhlB
MPDIEEFIGQKIPVKAITPNLLADAITPAKRSPKSKTAYQGKHTNQNRSRKPTARS